MAARQPTLDADTLQRVLVHVEADLAGDLRLGTLAAVAGLSRAHFQRAFAAAAKESPAAYVARVRAERAAYLLCVQDRSALEIALATGFANPDTFTRAFRRRFGVSPREHRRRGRFVRTRAASPADGRAAGEVGKFGDGWSLSPTRVVPLRALRVAFLRHVGPYETVDPALWTRLAGWAARRRVRHGPCVGIGHDAPGITAPERLRFDAGLLLDGDARPSDGVGVQTLAAGDFAVTTHAGPYSTLTAAYPEVFARSAAVRGFRVVGLPCIEVYHERTVLPGRPLSVTDIHLPVERTGAAARRHGRERHAQ